MIKHDTHTPAFVAQTEIRPGRRWSRRTRTWQARPSFVVGCIALGLVVLVAIVGPWLVPYNPTTQDLSNLLKPPSAQHLFGTDNYGRDIFSRVIYASRIDLQIGIIGVLLPWIIGVLLGLISGYVGGIVDTLIMRLLDTVAAFPFLVLVIGIIAILGPGLVNMYIGLTLVGWTAYARIVRGEVIVMRQLDFVGAIRNLGYSEWRIMLRHVLPNVVTPAIIFAMSDIVLTILATTSLSFLGLGVQPPTPEWGSMIAEGKSFITTAWWLVTFAGLAVVVVGVALSLFGDGLADVLRVED
jgi:peptide/nickel transport system permease protein